MAGYARAFFGPSTWAMASAPSPISTSYLLVTRTWLFSGGWVFNNDATSSSLNKMGWEHNNASIKANRTFFSFTAGAGSVGRRIKLQLNISSLNGTPSAYSLYWLTPTPTLDFSHASGGTAFQSAVTPAVGTNIYDTSQVVASVGQTFCAYVMMDNDIALAQASGSTGVDNHMLSYDLTAGTGSCFILY